MATSNPSPFDSEDVPPVEPILETTPAGKAVRLAGAALAIVAVCAGLYLMFRVDMADRVQEMVRYLGNEDAKFRKLAAHELWQTGESTTPDERLKAGIDDRYVGQSLLSAFRSGDGDVEIRRFQVLALGHFGCQEAVADMLREAQVTLLPLDLKLDILFSLGLLRNADAVSILVKETGNEDVRVRRVAAVSLGQIPDTAVVPPLKQLLSDPDLEVQWNSALALAEHGNAAGSACLQSMLDSEFLNSLQNLDARDRERILLNAMRAVARLKLEGVAERLAVLSKKDPNLRVRSAALSTLRSFSSQ